MNDGDVAWLTKLTGALGDTERLFTKGHTLCEDGARCGEIAFKTVLSLSGLPFVA